MPEKIVITGMGTVNPIGNNVHDSWKNAINGVSGLGPITLFDTSDHIIKVACEVKDFDPQEYLSARELRRRDRYQVFSAAAVAQALQQSGLEINESNASRVATVISSAVGGIKSMEDGVLAVAQKGPRRISPMMIPMLMSNGGAGLAGIDYGAKGPSFSITSACASGQDGIGMAWMMLRANIIDAAIAGASDATITPAGVAAFDRAQAVSRRGLGEPTPSPFDKNRDGLVFGEGAAIVILETESHARSRGAEILAELAGYSSTADAYHITAPSETGQSSSKAIRNALDSAEINLEEVGYINAHGTGTRLNDASETLAIKKAFGGLAYSTPISSTKSMTGHMMGATGALETLFCVLALRDNILPPTINYVEPDPDCDLDYIPNEAREADVDVAMSNAFGFGGHNAVLVVRKYN